MKIGVYSPNWIGDSVMALPFIKQLKNQNPQSEIYVICKSWVSGVYVIHSVIKKLIPIPSNYLNSYIGTIRTGLRLRSENFDLFYTLTDSIRSAFILWFSGAQIRYGYSAQMRSSFLTNPIPKPNETLHRSKKYLNLLGENSPISDIPELHLSDSENQWADKEMKNLGLEHPVALFPFSISDTRTISNNLLRKWINNSKNDYLIFGSKNDFERGNKLIESCKNNSIKSICGAYNLRQSIALISICKFALASDSGLGHISAALGIPTISFFGVGIAEITAPIGSNTHIIKHCRKCIGNACGNRDNQILCINKISKSDIEIAVNRFTKL